MREKQHFSKLQVGGAKETQSLQNNGFSLTHHRGSAPVCRCTLTRLHYASLKMVKCTSQHLKTGRASQASLLQSPIYLLSVCVCVCVTGGHKDGGTVCGVLLHLQKACEDWKERHAALR